jgi:hypothetical protein
MSTTTKRSRRWFQFGLRTLLFLVAFASIGFGWFGYKVRQAQRQKKAVEAVEKLGFVYYDYQFVSDNWDRTATPPGAEWLRNLVGVDFFANVPFAFCRFNDAEMVQLRQFPKLKVLVFESDQITDSGLAHLQGLSQLQTLCLNNTQITDAGLTYLQGMNQLQHLHLNGTQITDSGLVHLQGLNQLGLLDLDNTRVTDAGCQKLQEALPKLLIFR